MKVYVIEATLHGSSCAGTEVIAVHTSLIKAMKFVELREGLSFLDWREHNAHGPSWTANVQFRINNGPALVNQYVITEHEVES
jgi:hypothetical protein